MSYSKPLPPFVCDSLYYLNRNQLERFSIVCRPLKNFIERYLRSKPYRVFDHLWIREGSYTLRHNNVQWHPNQDDYTAQQYLAGRTLHNRREYYSFAEMRPYLGQTVRIEKTWIEVGTTYNPEHIEEMESIGRLWSDRKIRIWTMFGKILVSDEIQLILNSPTILQCRHLILNRAHFSFKDYKLLYNAKIIENYYYGEETDPDYWSQFLEQPGVKPLVVLLGLNLECINNVVDHLSKTFSSAVSPNAFKIVFALNCKPLTEFQKTNETSGEKLELKKGLPTEYQNEDLNRYFNYTAHVSFKDYNVLYNAKIIEAFYDNDKTDPDYWPHFLEQSGVKPLVVLRYLHRESINTVVDHLSKAFSSAISPNAFKIVFAQNYEPLTEFRKTNNASGEKLELKKGLPTEYKNEFSNEWNSHLNRYFNYTLERSII